MSIPEDKCVKLTSFKAVMGDTYTVIRTNGDKESEWYIPTAHHQCAAQCEEWTGAAASKHSSKNKDTWRIFMRNSHDQPDKHTCGWRRIETICPTRLNDMEDLPVQIWREDVIAFLEGEEVKRLAGANKIGETDPA